MRARVGKGEVDRGRSSLLPRGRLGLALVAAFVFSLVTLLGPLDPTPPAVAAGPVASVISTYQARIPELMAQQHIPGLAVAVVDRDRICGSRASVISTAAAQLP